MRRRFCSTAKPGVFGGGGGRGAVGWGEECCTHCRRKLMEVQLQLSSVGEEWTGVKANGRMWREKQADIWPVNSALA